MQINKKLLEEINRFRMMSSYQPGRLMTEQTLLNEDEKDPFAGQSTIPRLKGGSDSVSGEVNLENTESTRDGGTAPIAYFKNKGLFPGDSKKLYLNVSTIASKSNKTQPYEVSTVTYDDTPLTPSGTPESAPMELTFGLVGGFVYDRTNFNSKGQEQWDKFIKQVKKLKEENLDQWPNFIRYLKYENSKNQIYLRCYASRDGEDVMVADTNNKATTTLPRCRVAGGRPRPDYDLCLSQARANDSLALLEQELPDLAGIFKAKGEGQTNKWGDNKTEENRSPNRRLVLDKIPTYNSTTVYPGDGSEEEKKKKEEEEKKKNFKPITLNTEKTEISKFGPRDEGEYIYFYCQYFKKSDGYFISDNKNLNHRELRLKTNKYSWVHPSGGMDDTASGRDWKEDCEATIKPADGVWDIGESLGINTESKIEYWNAFNNSENIMIKERDIIEVFGNINSFYKYVPYFAGGFYFGTPNPQVVVDSKGVVAYSDGAAKRFPGWNSASEKTQMQNLNAVASTDYIPSVVKIEETGKTKFYEIGYYAFTIQRPTPRYKG